MSAPAASAERPLPVWRRPAAAAALRAALVPAGACAVVLLLLCVYTATGAAGDPPARIGVSDARILQSAGSATTTVLVSLRNTGPVEDTLESVSSLDLGVMVLARTVTENGESRTRPIGPVTVASGGSLRMDAFGVKVAVLDPPELDLGEKVGIDLWFRNSGRVKATAVTVRPGRP
ncbi:copper chaperone PCu(A)C [Streptomyces sp. AK04-3B]|uniref:copper chaperone PCu(A)C n=1 Tax=Streptomyces sp. AK04-3B TaxID=3028650 RepID=UPI0029A6DAB4|nr:copper chaperone PCu(A)C [Streptomyces sp. AK04-3B]MDX3802051.1 copper chaperone PCu(A)C [Streptomyces sp. AK04-3B]